MENLLTEIIHTAFPKLTETAHEHIHEHTGMSTWFFIVAPTALCDFQLSSSTAWKHVPNTCISRHLFEKDVAGFVCFGCKHN